MKTLIITTIFIFIQLCLFGQEWLINGNFTSTTDFLGSTNTEDLRFKTDNLQRAVIDADGFVGIATTDPDMRLHVDSGGVLVTGTVGSNPNLGGGHRLMYIPENLAFRGGLAIGNEWDAPNIGDFSFAYGADVTASSLSSFAFGQNLEITATANYSTCFGFNNSATNSHIALFGQNNNGSGVFSFAAGKNLDMTGNFNTAFGCFIDISSDNGMVFGSGLNGNPLTNTINNSMMVGFNSNLPTFFVEGAAGAGTIGQVGIGTTAPAARLHVRRDETTLDNTAARIQAFGGGDDVFALTVEALAQAAPNSANVRGINLRSIGDAGFSNNIGTQSGATGGELTTGVFGTAGGATFQNIGVAGRASMDSTITNIGVYGEADIAGYFTGPITTGAPLTISDQQFKSDVQDIEGAVSLINELRPRSYSHNQSGLLMNLSEGMHYGFIAQELQQVLPDAVEEVTKPEIRDPETGDVVSPALDHLAVNYQEIIPILVKATQEQQATIEQLQSDLADLQAQVAACCEAKSMNGQGSGESDFNLEVIPTPSDLKQNYPNPFAQQTTIQYTIGCACKAEIVVYDQSGRLIATLVSGSAEPGTYSVNWDASNLESGIYFYTLIVDRQEFVKRAVKI